MSNSFDRIIGRLDAISEKTPFPAMMRGEVNQRPRPRKFLPALLIAASVVALAMAIAGSKFALSVMMMTFVTTLIVQWFGPMRGKSANAPYDERERASYIKARLIGVSWALTLVVVGCMVRSLSGMLPPIWQPTEPTHWQLLYIFLISIAANVSMLALSWTMPAPVDDDE
ncbi:hypothetical protein [Sphingomonas sp. SUN039]|uniref:hypothetical protein n=1 Tax=Sphingomonas sp. SUN039 TaxID=2937787 RepID=UPI00216462C1|nr:hypothetical protein [Sphingomonas sp. SUN039]UVO55213.1 hypothetical protein M0209_14155 [Sphingomonas sp. SUN039]